MSQTTFTDLGVPAVLTQVLAAQGITTPTPIQAATLGDSLAGRDVLGRGRTGSGKTYAFLLPMLARLAASGGSRRPKRPRALILAPTRELVIQIEEAMAPLAKPLGLTSRTVFGGVRQHAQVTALRAGVDVVIACPGRLEDLIRQGLCSLDAVEITIIDEADHMSDLGFLPGVRRLLGMTPDRGQRMLFSATLDNAVDVLVKAYLHKPVTHEADSATAPPPAMSHHVLHVTANEHLPVLTDLAAAPGRTVIFTRTKHRAKQIAKKLNAAGVSTVELHGNLSQGARTRTMNAFHAGTATTLVATDIAARGIHVDDVGLVVHADPPNEHKAYLHRSGRTARAGNEGTVITLMTDSQVPEVRDLTRKAGVKATVTKVDSRHPLLHSLAPGERDYSGGFIPPVLSSNESEGSSRPRNARGSRAGQNGASRTGQGPGSGQASRAGQGARAGQGSRTPQGRGTGGARRGEESVRGSQSRRPSASPVGASEGGRAGAGGRTGARSGSGGHAHSSGAAAFSAGSSSGTRRAR